MLQNLRNKFIYLLLSTLFCLGSLEAFTRVLIPISPGTRRVDSEGNELDIIFNQPSSKYFQNSREFPRKLTTIDENGNRIVPSSNLNGQTKVIFLGDSFTFGQGLSDEETIPNTFCEKFNYFNCINLGIPGSGARRQSLRLKEFLSKNKVQSGYLIHLVFASTVQPFNGNDLIDTKKEIIVNKSVIGINKKSNTNYLVSFVRQLSKKSNLFRVIRVYFGNHIRSIAFSLPQSTFEEKDIKIFADELNKIAKISQQNNLKYLPILRSAMSEIQNKTVNETNDTLNNFLTVNLTIPNENVLTPNDKTFYLYDGHFNIDGAKRLANYLSSKFK